jgi:hypothetical protein
MSERDGRERGRERRDEELRLAGVQECSGPASRMSPADRRAGATSGQRRHCSLQLPSIRIRLRGSGCSEISHISVRTTFRLRGGKAAQVLTRELRWRLLHAQWRVRGKAGLIARDQFASPLLPLWAALSGLCAVDPQALSENSF